MDTDIAFQLSSLRIVHDHGHHLARQQLQYITSPRKALCSRYTILVKASRYIQPTA